MTPAELESIYEAASRTAMLSRPASSRHSVSQLFPYLSVAAFAVAVVAVPPSLVWNGAATLWASPVGSALVAIAAATIVCGSVASGLIWWFCQPTSRPMVHGLSNAPSSSIEGRKMRSTHAA